MCAPTALAAAACLQYVSLILQDGLVQLLPQVVNSLGSLSDTALTLQGHHDCCMSDWTAGEVIAVDAAQCHNRKRNCSRGSSRNSYPHRGTTHTVRCYHCSYWCSCCCSSTERWSPATRPNSSLNSPRLMRDTCCSSGTIAAASGSC